MDFINSFKNNFFQITAETFYDAVFNLFQYQAKNNPVYGNYLAALQIQPHSISVLEDIPFMPISFFRDFQVKTGQFKEEITFLSSGTTASIRSSHPVADLSWYKLISEEGFNRFYGPLSDYSFLAYLPSYLDNPNSSLIFMIRHFMEQAGNFSAFVKNEEDLLGKLHEIKGSGKKPVLIGVSYALMDMAEKGVDLHDVIVFETGGMKGRRKEIIREELHARLCQGLKVPFVHSEYGMTELLSQAWSKGNGIFHSPPWMKVLIREANDPFSIGTANRSGGINIIDLANIHSCAFIETQDLGRVHPDGSFEVQGRMDNAEVRGCSLMYF